MTKQFLALLLSVAAALYHAEIASAQELEPIGLQPNLAADWELIDEQQREMEAKVSFRWRVFRHKTTNDLLSLATHPNLGKDRPLEYLSDTSLEIFPDGRAVWTQPRRNMTTNVVAIAVVDIGRTVASLRGEKVLEYCFISESPDRDNLMAHGRAWTGPKGVVFVQHTSAKPITAELVDRTLKSIISAKALEATPKEAAQPQLNQAYVKIIMPTAPVDRDQDRPVVESWIAEDLKRRGQARFTAVTGWVSLDLSPIAATDVWKGGELGDTYYCPVGADIPDRAKGRITVQLSGWSPGGAFATVSMTDEPGSRAIAAVKEMETERGMPYVAVLIGPPTDHPAAPTDRKE